MWHPTNLSAICPPNSNLMQCSSFGYFYLNLLVQLYGKPIDHGNRDTYKREREVYDFIVVGAGAAGCVLANRLSENPDWKVLLLEAGPEQPEVSLGPAFSSVLVGSSIDWKYTVTSNGKFCLSKPGNLCTWPRGKVLGGSTTINSMSYIRGNRADFDGWAALGNEGWSYEEVLPYFIKAEKNYNIEELDRKYHGSKGPQAVSSFPYIDIPSRIITKGFNEGGLPLTDFNGFQQIGTMQAQATAKHGKRASTYSAFIQPIRHQRKNLVIKTGSEVYKILINKHKNAYGVVYKRNCKTYRAYARREVIVSGGTINSPKLLMLSGIGPRKHLESQGIPVIQELSVGKNLHDHVTFDGIIIELSNTTKTTVSKEELVNEVYKYGAMKMKNGPISGNGAVSSISFLPTLPELTAPDIQFQCDDVTSWRDFIRDPILYRQLLVFPTAFYDGVLPRPMNLVPFSRGYIELNATNPCGPPVIYANYFADDRDFLPLIRASRFLFSLENTEAFKSTGTRFVKKSFAACKNHEWGTDEYVVCIAKHYTSSTYHPVGTCKMGPSRDKTAVVDNTLRVYGVGNLRVIDASIMPVSTRGNTNAPTIMIGWKGSEMIIKYWNNRQ